MVILPKNACQAVASALADLRSHDRRETPFGLELMYGGPPGVSPTLTAAVRRGRSPTELILTQILFVVVGNTAFYRNSRHAAPNGMQQGSLFFSSQEESSLPAGLASVEDTEDAGFVRRLTGCATWQLMTISDITAGDVHTGRSRSMWIDAL